MNRVWLDGRKEGERKKSERANERLGNVESGVQQASLKSGNQAHPRCQLAQTFAIVWSTTTGSIRTEQTRTHISSDGDQLDF